MTSFLLNLFIAMKILQLRKIRTRKGRMPENVENEKIYKALKVLPVTMIQNQKW